MKNVIFHFSSRIFLIFCLTLIFFDKVGRFLHICHNGQRENGALYLSLIYTSALFFVYLSHVSQIFFYVYRKLHISHITYYKSAPFLCQSDEQEAGAAGTNQEHSNHLAAVPAMIIILMTVMLMMIMMTVILVTKQEHSNHLPAVPATFHISVLPLDCLVV